MLSTPCVAPKSIPTRRSKRAANPSPGWIWKCSPTTRRMPLRRRITGVCTVLAARTTPRRAWSVTRRADARHGSRWVARARTPVARPPRGDHLVDTARCEDPRAEPERARHVGDVHPLFGAVRAAVQASTGSPAPLVVAVHLAHAEAARAHLLQERAVVLAEHLVVDRAHGELALQGAKCASSEAGARVSPARSPATSRRARPRSAPGDGGVDHRAPAHAPPLEEREEAPPLDGLHGRVAHHATEGAEQVFAELARLDPTPLFDDGHAMARGGQHVRRHRPRGPRADHHEVERLVDLALQRLAVDHSAFGQRLVGVHDGMGVTRRIAHRHPPRRLRRRSRPPATPLRSAGGRRLPFGGARSAAAQTPSAPPRPPGRA